MTDRSANPQRAIPDAFNQYRQARFERTVQLTKQAIAKLKAEGKTITLAGVCEATRALDEQGNGLQPITILRNPEAAELFHQHSPAYQARQQKAQKAKRQRTQAKNRSEARTPYQGLRTADLIQIVEGLKAQIAELKAQQAKRQTERDEAYQLRDEALQQNARQLALLTAQVQSPNKKR